jgi:hypothetical protein
LQSPSGEQALIALKSQWSVGIGGCAPLGASAVPPVAGVSAWAETIAATDTAAATISL